MANLGGNFDASNGPGMQDRSALPAGPYTAAIVASEVKQSKNKPQNSYINVEFQVMGGEREGAKFWTILNLWNDNSTAVDIAERELRSICKACGKLSVQDTEELHGIPMTVTLKVEKSDLGENNRAVSYEPAGGGGAVTQSNGASQQGQGDGGAPWRR